MFLTTWRHDLDDGSTVLIQWLLLQLSRTGEVRSLVRQMVLHGWQPQAEDDFRPYEQHKLELSVQNGCVLWGSRLQGRQHVLEILHEGHPGISRMKSLAKGIVWWLKFDADQESLVRSCKACQENQKCLMKVQLHLREWLAEP